MAKDSRCLSVPEYVRYLGVADAKVHRWILDGQLRALNVSGKTRPIYRLTPEAIAEFERRVSTLPEPIEALPRRRAITVVKDYFADVH